MILHLPQNTEAWRAHRSEVLSDGPVIGGSDLWRWLGMHSFASASPADTVTRIGHTLEPLILLRLAQILDVAPFERDYCAIDDQHPWMRGSLDGVLLDGDTPILMADAKAVLLGSADQWRRTGAPDPLDGCPAHVRYQMLWYVGIVGVPLYVAALLIPDFTLQLDPVLASQLYELRLYRFDPADHADEIATLRETVATLRARGVYPPPSPLAPPPGPTRGPILPGSLADGQVIARWTEARRREAAATATARAAAAAVHAIIPSHARGITAGGYTVIRDVRGSLRLRS